MKYTEMVKQGQIKLFKSGIANADNDAWILLEKICCVSKVDYFTKMLEEVPKDMETAYFEAIEKRKSRYPLQYIIGEWEFMGLTFKVNENVLIPRQDTETLVETALRILDSDYRKEGTQLEVMDMCTGSGCIAISIAKACSDVNMTAVDLSEKALEIAKENAVLNHIDKIKFIRSDLYEDFAKDKVGYYEKYDMIVSNPPYINSKVIDTLMPEVKNFEPRMALDGDEDGLKFYRGISSQSNKYLKKDGCLIFEIGYDQAEAVEEILFKNWYKDIQIIKDLTGKDRVVIARKK